MKCPQPRTAYPWNVTFCAARPSTPCLQSWRRGTFSCRLGSGGTVVCWGAGASEFRETAGECSGQGRPWGRLTLEKSLKDRKSLGGRKFELGRGEIGAQAGRLQSEARAKRTSGWL